MTLTDYPAWDLPAKMPVSARAWPTFPVILTRARQARLDGGSGPDPLLCEQIDRPMRSAYTKQPTRLFEQFLQLGREGDEEIAQFANRYGTLGLCRHGVPMTIAQPCSRHRWRGFEGERPQDWRAWVRRFTAAFEIAQSLQKHVTPSASTIEQLLEPAEHFDAENTRAALLGRLRALPRARTHAMQSWYFCGVINRWLHTRLTITAASASRSGFSLEYGPADLFSTLAYQVALAITGTVSLVVCSNCGRPFRAARQPREGVRSWCDRAECRLAKNRCASKAYRDRKRTAPYSSASGKSSARAISRA